MKKNIPIILFVITLVCGTIGYIMAELSPYEALISSFSLVVLNGPLEPSNLLIEIARWSGILFALDIVYTLVETAISASTEDLRARSRVNKPGATAVHGDGLFADKLAESLGDVAIRSDHAISFEAPCQVLLFSDDELAVDFMNRHINELSKAKEVYIGLDRMTPDMSKYTNMYTFNMAEVCAQLYWEDYPVTSPERIALIGEGAYAEALLTQALLVNIYDIAGGIEYRLYGNFDQYRHLHTQLDEALRVNSDTLVFCDQPWHAELDQLKECSRIILCGTTDFNLETASKLQCAYVKAPLHIRCDDKTNLNLVKQENALAFGTTEQLCTSAIVIQQHQHDAGKISDIAYRLGKKDCEGCTRQAGFPADTIEGTPGDKVLALKKRRLDAVDYTKCFTCPLFMEKWREMDLFTKSSNYAVAAHDRQKMHLLEQLGAGRDSGKSITNLSLEKRDYLQEIEHIRWCRFHFLNNWRYAPGDKDEIAHTHHYLVPYDQLERKIKDYDADAYETIWLRNKL